MKKLAIISGMAWWVGLGFGDWWFDTIDTTYGLIGNSIAVDSFGYPHIVYPPYGGWFGRHVSWNPFDSSWTLEFEDSLSIPLLKFDSKDLPHIVGYHYGKGKYIYKDTAGMWHTEGDRAWHMGYSFDLDSKNYAHIMQEIKGDTWGYDTLFHWYKDSTGWHTEELDATGGVMQDIHLCIGADNYPRIAYLADDSLRYAWFDGNLWNIIVLDTGVYKGKNKDFLPYDVDMVVDKYGYSHICYLHKGEKCEKYARGHGFMGTEESEKCRVKSAGLELYSSVVRGELRISYILTGEGLVNVSIYNILGQKVGELVNEQKESGKYTDCWIPSNVVNGVYFCRFKSVGSVITKKFIVIGG